jgi:predicted TIM-barrel fold metal-dependent hydrolase
MPRRQVAQGAVDCHVHVFDPARFPFAADAAYRPVPAEWATADDLVRLLDAHGIARVVVVNPTSGYGDDNACLLDALERLGARARGIARVPVSIAPRELDALARRGVAGVRVDFVALGLAPLRDAAFPRLLSALAERDLLLDVQAECEQWSEIVPAIASVPVRVVVDHMGRPRPELGVDAAAFKALLGLAATGRVAVKLSGPDRFSRCPPPYPDTIAFASAIVREFTAQRLVWGSDWPFLRAPRRMDYAPTLDWLERVVAADHERTRILAETPARWFGFPP